MTQPSHDTVATHPPRPYLLPPLEGRRRALSPRVGYAVAALVVGLGLFASVTPSPLYRSYSVLWHFSPLTLTLIYATYAFGVLASLLLAGGVSDDVGRRPVLLVALGALAASSVLFMVAESAAWLFVARGLQGLATGAALSAASAALLDLHPNRDPAGVGLTTARAAAGGIGLGALVSSALVQLGTLPRVLPYVVLLVLFAVAFAGAYWMPEPVEKRGRFRLKAERPSVPAVVRRLSGRLGPRRRRRRRRLPRRPPRAHSSHPASAPRRSHLGLLRRRLHLPLAAGRPRRHRRRTRRAAHDLRDLRKRRRRDRS